MQLRLVTLVLLAGTAVACSNASPPPAPPRSTVWTALLINHARLMDTDCCDYEYDYSLRATCSTMVNSMLDGLEPDLATLPADKDRADLERAIADWRSQFDTFSRNGCFVHETAPECASGTTRLELRHDVVKRQIEDRADTEQRMLRTSTR
ncbi:hypothetical protein ACQPW1_22070 [Nocardia sp. CA-128927]|uniref:hypothetical protein n=1 Tax=Nocardia sp. CA-128927 TaxID=3239975 RepID=UPI003D983861